MNIKVALIFVIVFTLLVLLVADMTNVNDNEIILTNQHDSVKYRSIGKIDGFGRGIQFYEMSIDGCYYIVAYTDSEISITHKGNCTALIHRLN